MGFEVQFLLFRNNNQLENLNCVILVRQLLMVNGDELAGIKAEKGATYITNDYVKDCLGVLTIRNTLCLHVLHNCLLLQDHDAKLYDNISS